MLKQAGLAAEIRTLTLSLRV